MANPYMNLYMGNPTAGGTDGTIVSLDGSQTSPVTFTLDATEEESGTQVLALRCEDGYRTEGDTEITFTGTTAYKWSASLDGSYYDDSITIESSIGTRNTLFYVQASSSDDESPRNDTSVLIKVTAKVVPSE